MKIKTLPPNVTGRDFVCGDLHGCRAFLDAALEALNFDEKRDRLISVGDLVDRGPDSAACLRLLHEPWFHAVCGNHEQLMMDFMHHREYPFPGIWLSNGGGWGCELRRALSDEDYELRELILNHVETLPYLITVQQADGSKFHVLHAELAFNNEVTDETLSSWDSLAAEALPRTSDGATILWGRWIFCKMYMRELSPEVIENILAASSTELQRSRLTNPQLSHIYSGHTIVRRPVTFFGQTNLDTGAVMNYAEPALSWAGLTITQPATNRFWMSNKLGFQEVEPVVFK